jgi:hypothetical protein
VWKYHRPLYCRCGIHSRFCDLCQCRCSFKVNSPGSLVTTCFHKSELDRWDFIRPELAKKKFWRKQMILTAWPGAGYRLSLLSLMT